VKSLHWNPSVDLWNMALRKKNARENWDEDSSLSYVQITAVCLEVFRGVKLERCRRSKSQHPTDYPLVEIATVNKPVNG